MQAHKLQFAIAIFMRINRRFAVDKTRLTVCYIQEYTRTKLLI